MIKYLKLIRNLCALVNEHTVHVQRDIVREKGFIEDNES